MGNVFVLLTVLAVAACSPWQDVQRYENEEFRFGLVFPANYFVCRVGPRQRDDGITILLDSDACVTTNKGGAVTVGAEYNALYYTNVKKFIADGCTLKAMAFDLRTKPVEILQAPLGLQIGDLKSAACRVDSADGSIDIEVGALGRPPLPPFKLPEDRAPEIRYTAWLNTNRRHIDADLAAFRSILRRFQIAAECPGCSDVVHYENKEFGFRLDIPKAYVICHIEPYQHERGVGFLLDSPRSGCLKKDDSRSIISVGADYNSEDYLDVEASLQDDCSPDDANPGELKEAPVLPKIGGVRTVACRMDYANGRIVIKAETMVVLAPEPHKYPAYRASQIIYKASLYTTEARFDADLRAFRSVVGGVQIFMPPPVNY